MPFRGLDLTGGGAGSASGSRNLLVNQHSFLTISLICLSVLPSTGTPSWARGSSSRQPPVSLQKLKHLRTGLQGAGEPTAQHFVCGTPEPPGALLWVPCAGCRPFPICLGFQGPSSHCLLLSPLQDTCTFPPPPPPGTSQVILRGPVLLHHREDPALKCCFPLPLAEGL